MLAATAVAVRPLSFLYPLGSLSVGSAASTSRRVLFSSSARTHYAPPPPQGEAAVVHPVREPPNPLPPPQKAYLSEEQRSQQGQFEDMRRSGRVPAAPRPAGGSTAASTQSQTQTQAAGSTSSSAKTTTAGAHNEACATLSPSSPSAPRSQKSAKPAEARAAESKTAASMPTASATETVKKASPARKAGGGGKVFRPKKAALSLTPTAVLRLRELLDSDGGPRLIRIGVRNKGCAGMSYHLEYVTPDQAGKFDERVKQDGVEVLIDSKALFSIIGSEMDWKEDRLSSKFEFNNPNVKEACGCGESFLT